MREILFRGKTTGEELWAKEEEWIYGDLIHDGYDFDFGIREHKDKIVRIVEEVTIGQFTGLTDKNGTKIFEGDILAIKFFPAYVERICWQGPPDAIAKVYWDYSGFGLNATNGKDRRYPRLCEANFKETEVIGNIHDNPELIGGAAE